MWWKLGKDAGNYQPIWAKVSEQVVNHFYQHKADSMQVRAAQFLLAHIHCIEHKCLTRRDNILDRYFTSFPWLILKKEKTCRDHV